MIIRITFDDGRVMMFGDSYKPWTMQFDEYMWRVNFKPVKFESCQDKWIGWGGLKWCSESRFQNHLNREGCQDEDENNPNPRKFEDMKFVENPIVRNKALKILKRV